MARTVVVRGHVVGSNTVQVEAPLPPGVGDVEVVMHIGEAEAGRPDRVGEFLERLPAGMRSKEDIDRQVDEDRGAWDR